MSRRLLAWMSLVLLLAAPLALADDDGKEDDGDRRGEKRKLDLDLDDLKATIKLERDLGGSEDAVKVEFDAEKAKLQVKHESKDAANESEQKLEARFLALVEYADADADGAYDAGEAIASAWSLGESEKDAKVPMNGTVEWGDLAVTDVASGNASGKKLSGRASFEPNATFGLDLFVYGDFALVGDASLEPTETKIDIIIRHYPYARNDTALAVLVDLKAKEEFKSEDAGENEAGVSSQATSGNLTFRLTFTWLETATVDGVERPVHATVLRNKEEVGGGEVEQKARVALSYARGDVIVHDPTVGVSYGAQSVDARGVPAPPAALVVGVVALAALARRLR